MLRITVVSGEVSRQTAILAAALYPGAFGGDTGEDEFDDKPWGDDTSDDGDSDDDGSGYDDYYDSGGCDDHDDRPYDDHGKGQDRDGEEPTSYSSLTETSLSDGLPGIRR